MKISEHLPRLLIIYNRIRKGDYPSKDDIQKYLSKELESRGFDKIEFDAKTIERDLKQIKDLFRLEIKYDKSNLGYCIDEEGYTEKEVDAFLDAFDILTCFGSETGKPDYIFPEERRSRGTKYLFDLSKAIKDSKTVTFLYEKFDLSESKVRTVEPYALKESRGRWYLLAIENGVEVLKSFGLDRFQSLSINDSKFEKLQIDIEKKFEHSFAMYTKETLPEKVRLRYSVDDAKFLEAMPIHKSQKITWESNNKALIELTIHVTEDLIIELMSRSWSVEVLEPLWLREKLCDTFKEAWERNK